MRHTYISALALLMAGMASCTARDRPDSGGQGAEGGSNSAGVGGGDSGGAGGTPAGGVGGASSTAGSGALAGSAGAAGGGGVGGADFPCTKSVPVAAADAPGSVVEVQLGDGHTCALFDSGAIRCWGLGLRGQLGYGSDENVADGKGPTIAEAGNVPVGCAAKDIALGREHTCAVLEGGGLRCWGFGGDGRLGHDAPEAIGADRSIADAGNVPVGAPVQAVTAGYAHTCALLESGAVRCWGDNQWGQLGYDNTLNVGNGQGLSIMSVGDVPLGAKALAVDAGRNFTCAKLEGGSVRCWGAGALGYNSTEPVGDGIGLSILEAGDVAIGGAVSVVQAGDSHACALLEGGAVRCWGQALLLGYGDLMNVGEGGWAIADAGDLAMGGAVTALEAGRYHTCARYDEGGVRCWGWSEHGQLGYGSIEYVDNDRGPGISEVGEVELGGPAASVAVGAGHSCAVLQSGSVVCWGRNEQGELGEGSTDNRGDDDGEMPPPALTLY